MNHRKMIINPQAMFGKQFIGTYAGLQQTNLANTGEDMLGPQRLPALPNRVLPSQQVMGEAVRARTDKWRDNLVIRRSGGG